jgi:Aspartyl protease
LRRGVPFVSVMVNGRGPYTFAVDTGTAREAIVSPALARELKLPLAGRTWLLDLTGKNRRAVDTVLVDEIELPGLALRSVAAMVHQPVAGLGSYDGILGFAFFRDAVLTLDFPDRCLRLEDAGLGDGPDPNVLPFTTPRMVPVVELAIGGRTFPAQIDSGGGGINIPRSAAGSVHLDRRTQVLIRADSQVGTFFLHGGVMDGDIALGGHLFREPFVEIGDQIPVGNLGASSLQDFAVTFDQARGLVRFRADRRVHRLERRQLEAQPEEAKADGGAVAYPGGN